MTDLQAGVVGVGSMGVHHARVYAHKDDVELVGIHDVDTARARTVAAEYDTRAMDVDALMEACDLATIAVPTEFHYPMATKALSAGVNVLVEKPLVRQPERGCELVERAREEGLVLQVGHVERFNPAVETASDVVSDLDVIAVEARRLGPPVDRAIDDNAVFDLMVHDLDIALSLVDSDVASVAASGGRDGAYATAVLTFENGVVGQFTASRVTQQKVRQLSVTADECRANVDYADQTVHIHRRSVPEYVEREGDVRFRHESLIERPTVENGEPLAAEIDAFVEAVRTGATPKVTGEDGLRVLSLADRIESELCDVSTPTSHARTDVR